MSRKIIPNVNQKRGVEIFSNLMLMKFRPRTVDGSKTIADSHKNNKNILSLIKNKQQAKVDPYEAVKHLRYL